MLFTWMFWNDTLQRATRSFAQGTMTVLTGDVFNFWTADWKTAFGVGLGTAAYSILMSVDRSGGGSKTDEPAAPVVNNAAVYNSRAGEAP